MCGTPLLLTASECSLHNIASAPTGPFKSVMHASHGIAHCLGGPAVLDNLHCCCAECNLSMGTRTPFEWARECAALIAAQRRNLGLEVRESTTTQVWWLRLEASFLAWEARH